MLPTMVIGADEATRDELNTRWLAAAPAFNVLAFYDTAEEALFALADGLLTVGGDGDAVVVKSGPDGWPVNILWGPNAWGPALVGNKPELAHTGWTAVFAAGVDDAPGKPRRVRDGAPEGAAPDTRVWQAAPVMRAQLAFDVLGHDGSGGTAVAAIVDRFESRDTP